MDWNIPELARAALPDGENLLLFVGNPTRNTNWAPGFRPPHVFLFYIRKTRTTKQKVKTKIKNLRTCATTALSWR